MNYGSVTIVIVNWNSGSQLGECLDSIAANGDGCVDSTVVVDNGSYDGSDRVAQSRANVALISLAENAGFARACNIGAFGASTEYLLFLNPDAALFPGVLKQVVAFLADPANGEVGICGVKLVNESGDVWRSCARFPTPARLLYASLGVDRFMPRLGTTMKEWDHSNSSLVDQVIGAFFFVRRDLFNKLNGFDERFFVYFEEVDFAYRASRVGAYSYYLSEVKSFHAGGGTSNQVRAQRLFYSMRSRVLYSFKHFSRFSACLVLGAMILVEPVSRLIGSLFRPSRGSTAEIFTGLVMFWRWLPSWIFRGAVR